LEKFDFIPELSTAVATSSADFVGYEVCGDATSKLPANPNQDKWIFPQYYNLSCRNTQLPSPAQCAPGAPLGKATYQFLVVPRTTCGNGVRDPGEECDAGATGDATCTRYCRRINP
jgi:hypothetical protein